MSVAQLVDLYESLDRPYQLSLDILSSPVQKQASYSNLQSNIRTMYNHKNTISQPSSVRSDSMSTSPSPSACDSPASLHSSPTFYSSDDSRFQSTTASTSQNVRTLPPFSVNTLQSLMSAPKTQARQGRRPWYTRRALSQIDLALESESRAEGIENLGLGLFEPRPRETTVSRQSSQGSVVLDGILEVMESAK